MSLKVAAANGEGAGVDEEEDADVLVFFFVAFAFVVVSSPGESAGASSSTTAASEFAATELTMLLLLVLSFEETEGDGCCSCCGLGPCCSDRSFVTFLSFEVPTSLLSSESLLDILLLKEEEDARCAMVNSNYKRTDNKINKSIDVNETNINGVRAEISRSETSLKNKKG